MIKAKREGVLALEDDCYGGKLTETDEIIFNKKVDLFIARLLRFIVDGCYSTEGNLELLKSMSRSSGKKTRTALKIASSCMDFLANGKNLDKVLMPVNAFVGENNYKVFIELFKKLEREYDESSNQLVLTEDQRKRFEEVNVYFRMKEDECAQFLKKKYEEVCALHKRVPELEEYYASVHLIYKWKKNEGEGIFSTSSRSSTTKEDSPSFFIGGLPVCRSLHSFWVSYLCCWNSIQKFMYLTDDIPNRLENLLDITSEMKLCSSSVIN